MDRLAPPSAKHLLGADGAGRDILTRLIHGARISLVVGLAATTVTIVVAAAIGVPSGYLGGRYDIVVQRFVDGWMAFPGLLVLLTVMSIVGRGTLQIIVVLGILYGIHNSRVLRSAVIVIKENDYIAAAAATGNRKLRTVLRHVLPNIVAPVIIIYSINICYIVLDEAALSFLGFGLPLEVPSWGGMLSGDGHRYMERKPELALFPGICLAVVVYGVNMFGDAVRDLLDPRLKGGGGRALGVYRSPAAPPPASGGRGRDRPGDTGRSGRLGPGLQPHRLDVAAGSRVQRTSLEIPHLHAVVHVHHHRVCRSRLRCLVHGRVGDLLRLDHGGRLEALRGDRGGSYSIRRQGHSRALDVTYRTYQSYWLQGGFPDRVQREQEPGHYRISRQRNRTFEPLHAPVRGINCNPAAVGVDQPTQARAVGLVLLHLALCVRRRIGGRTKFDDEVGTQRQESPLLFGGEPRQTTAQYPGHVR